MRNQLKLFDSKANIKEKHGNIVYSLMLFWEFGRDYLHHGPRLPQLFNLLVINILTVHPSSKFTSFLQVSLRGRFRGRIPGTFSRSVRQGQQRFRVESMRVWLHNHCICLPAGQPLACGGEFRKKKAHRQNWERNENDGKAFLLDVSVLFCLEFLLFLFFGAVWTWSWLVFFVICWIFCSLCKEDVNLLNFHVSFFIRTS